MSVSKGACVSSSRRRPGAEQDRPTPHTEQHATADGETGDRDPEADAHAERMRRNLEGAAEVTRKEQRDQRDDA